MRVFSPARRPTTSRVSESADAVPSRCFSDVHEHFLCFIALVVERSRTYLLIAAFHSRVSSNWLSQLAIVAKVADG